MNTPGWHPDPSLIDRQFHARAFALGATPLGQEEAPMADEPVEMDLAEAEQFWSMSRKLFRAFEKGEAIVRATRRAQGEIAGLLKRQAVVEAETKELERQRLVAAEALDSVSMSAASSSASIQADLRAARAAYEEEKGRLEAEIGGLRATLGGLARDVATAREAVQKDLTKIRDDAERDHQGRLALMAQEEQMAAARVDLAREKLAALRSELGVQAPTR